MVIHKTHRVRYLSYSYSLSIHILPVTLHISVYTQNSTTCCHYLLTAYVMPFEISVTVTLSLLLSILRKKKAFFYNNIE